MTRLCKLILNDAADCCSSGSSVLTSVNPYSFSLKPLVEVLSRGEKEPNQVNNHFASSHLMTFRKVCTNVTLTTVLESYNLEIHQKKSKPDSHRLNEMAMRSIEQDLRTQNCLRPETGELSQTCWSRIRGNNVKFKRTRWLLVVEGPSGSVRKETVAISGTMQLSVPNLGLSPLLLPENILNHRM